ncbi:hypothetical protein [Bacillus sp. JCM 19041]|uniref:hypothetical protein n=1 Tax=Bacillus sp. JCM 19041 TaxID=1460637 RepID=UPI000B11061F
MASIRTHVVMRPEDNVATALTFIEKNKRVPLDQGGEVSFKQTPALLLAINLPLLI